LTKLWSRIKVRSFTDIPKISKTKVGLQKEGWAFMHKNTDHKNSTMTFNAAATSLLEVETEHKRHHKLMLVASAVTSGALALILAVAALGFSAPRTMTTKDDHIGTPLASLHIIR
jgi:hypothetical protein